MINLYPIVNIAENGKLDEHLVDVCLRINAEYLQIRMKNSTGEEILDVVKGVVKKRNLAGSGTKIIVNDNLEVALVSKADGVHLGQDDINAEMVKKEYPDLIVGLSTHDYEQIRQANRMNIDYIGFGPVFKTTTKNTRDRLVLDKVHEAVKLSVHPVVFIGGINVDNVDMLPKGKKIYIASVSGLEKLAGVFNAQ